MEINELRSAVTVLSFLIFIGIIWWAYSDRRRQSYEQAARIPLDDDELSSPCETLPKPQVLHRQREKQQKGTS
ncbi:MAG TPA: cbb3-type cytochrome c oxidase subunit 3 [Rugosibacter sp.]|nr:cbb3-type cytochrome c oxidase subunit 3 [Rugosibacter sp.]